MQITVDDKWEFVYMSYGFVNNKNVIHYNS